MTDTAAEVHSSPKCQMGCVTSPRLVQRKDVTEAILKATKLDLHPPRKTDTLELALARKLPVWGTQQELVQCILNTLIERLQDPHWVVGMKACLVIHTLLWRGGSIFVDGIQSMNPPLTPSLMPSYCGNSCGQGHKQEPIIRFIAGMDMMLASTLKLLPDTAAHELAKGCQGRTVHLIRLPRVVSIIDLPVLSAALQAAAQLNAHLMYLVSATDLNFLAFDNVISVEVVKCTIEDCKAVFNATRRIFDQLCRIDPTAAYIIPRGDRLAWTSLYKSFVLASIRMGRLFADFRNLNINVQDTLPRTDADYTAPPTLMSNYWKSVDRAAQAAAEAAASGLGVVMLQTAAPSKLTSDSDAMQGVADSTPSNSNAAGEDKTPSDRQNPDSFVEGALTEDEESATSSAGSASAAFASRFESSSPERYVLGNVLGKGAFGTVFRAFDTENGTFVAIKQLQALTVGPLEDGSALPRSLVDLQSEFKMLTKLSDPHVVSVYDIEVVNGKPRIIMEWMPGGSVQAALKLTKHGFREPVVARYMKQALEGLTYLHANNVIHRDIKPGNMLLSSTGDLKLSDFGTSRLLSEVTDSMRTGSVVGTIPFLAPECFTGTYGAASDVWAMGCSALEMLTGLPPWSETHAKDSISLVFIIGNAKAPNHHPKLPDVYEEAASPLLVSSNGGAVKSNLGSGTGFISTLARDFLLQCFEYDHHRRSSAADLLSHEFIKQLA